MLSPTNVQVGTATDRTSLTGYAYVKYAKTTDTPVTRDEAYGNGGAGFDDYSTSETVTNKRWLGSTVYRKVVSLGALPNATVKSVAHGIISYSAITALHVIVQNGAGTAYALNIVEGGNTDATYMDTTNVYLATATDRTAFSAYAVIEYTKP